MHKLLLFFFLVFILGCQSEKLTPGKGVSFELQELRKKTISGISYRLKLEIPPEKTKAITGQVTICFELLNRENDLILDFNSDSSHVLKVQIKEKAIPYTYGDEHLVIDAQYLSKGENKITIDFIAGDLSLNRNEDFLYTLFVPDRASTCIPMFDQPNLKASYEVSLTIPSAWEAVTNGALKEKRIENNRTIYDFERTKPISSYLLAFAVGKFYKVSKNVEGREITMYYRETDSAKVNRNVPEIFKLHSDAIKWLEDYTAIKYPFDKFDFALIPSFQYGGMEHPGSIFYNEASMLLDEHASVNRKMGRASLIAHETAHMWFGDLVTMDWFNDVWMKEVFANFMAAKIIQPSFPETNHNLRFLLSHYPSAYEVDRTDGANPILQSLSNLKNAGTLYGAIIYQKAPVVMRHLERKIGEDGMKESLREYLKKYSYNNATWDDLIAIMDSRSTGDIINWSNVWVKTAGMPTYEFHEEGLRQVKDTVSNRFWQQPILVFRGGMTDTLLNLQSNMDLPFVKSKTYNFPNSDGFGYGYFKMDEESQRVFLNNPSRFEDPVLRASMWINCWENFIHGDGPLPGEMVNQIRQALLWEEDPLIMDFLLDHLQPTWWNFLQEEERALLQVEMEETLWEKLNSTPHAGQKNSCFRTYCRIGISEKALLNLEFIWREKKKVHDLVLSEEDKLGLAFELALKRPFREKEILEKQLTDTKNPDRKQRMKFVMPALSAEEATRQAFFESLKIDENREHEAWVLEALDYLHHPLRTSSVQFLSPSLEMLETIQLTGDIFFPQRWLHHTFSNYATDEAVNIAENFLISHPDYPLYLRNKIRQALDQTKRGASLKNEERYVEREIE